MTPPVGIYVRVSRKGEREDDRFHSPREQAERAGALAVAKGFEPGPVFEDIDVSGATHPSKRPALSALLAEVKAGKLAGVAAFSLDRLSREPAHGDELVRQVTKAGGVLLTPDIPDAIDSPTGEFTFGMLLQVARLYRSQAGARFASAKERAILAGIPVGPTPYGYRQGPDRKLEVDPAAAPVVRELFERRARGEGPASLSDWLNAEGHCTLTVQGVRALLRRRVYATGRLEYGNDLVSEHDAGAIVDEPLWHAAQHSVGKPQKARSAEAPWLLSGLLKCACCGYNLRPHTSGQLGTRRYRTYHCRNRRCEARASVQAERIEPWVVVQSFAAGDELETQAQLAPSLAPLEAAVASTKRRLDQVLAPEARDALGDLWAADAKARREEHEAALRALGEAQQASDVPARSLRLRDVWAGLSPVDRREALHLFWKEIRVARPVEGELAVTLVARGPLAEAEVALPTS